MESVLNKTTMKKELQKIVKEYLDFVEKDYIKQCEALATVKSLEDPAEESIVFANGGGWVARQPRFYPSPKKNISFEGFLNFIKDLK